MNRVVSALNARVFRPLRNRLRLDEGLEAVEYALIAALLSVVIILAMTAFGDGVQDIFDSIGQRLTTEAGNVDAAPDGG